MVTYECGKEKDDGSDGHGSHESGGDDGHKTAQLQRAHAERAAQ